MRLPVLFRRRHPRRDLRPMIHEILPPVGMRPDLDVTRQAMLPHPFHRHTSIDAANPAAEWHRRRWRVPHRRDHPGPDGRGRRRNRCRLCRLVVVGRLLFSRPGRRSAGTRSRISRRWRRRPLRDSLGMIYIVRTPSACGPHLPPGGEAPAPRRVRDAHIRASSWPAPSGSTCRIGVPGCAAAARLWGGPSDFVRSGVEEIP